MKQLLVVLDQDSTKVILPSNEVVVVLLVLNHLQQHLLMLVVLVKDQLVMEQLQHIHQELSQENRLPLAASVPLLDQDQPLLQQVYSVLLMPTATMSSHPVNSMQLDIRR